MVNAFGLARRGARLSGRLLNRGASRMLFLAAVGVLVAHHALALTGAQHAIPVAVIFAPLLAAPVVPLIGDGSLFIIVEFAVAVQVEMTPGIGVVVVPT